MISVIVPVYNIQEDYLRTCIKSVQDQSYRDWELILVDDGSPDRSGAICDEYAEKDERIIVIHQRNQGVSAARNTGLERARGGWITFLDADDWVDKDTLQVALDTALRDHVDMVVWNHCFNTPSGETVRGNYPRDLIVRDEMLMEEINLNFLRTISVKKGEIRIPTLEGPVAHLFRRDIIMENHIRYDTSLKQGEDKLFNYEYHKYIKSFTYRNLPMYHYRQHQESTTHTFYDKSVENSTSVLYKYYETEPRIQTDPEYRNTWNIRVGVIAYFLIGKYYLHENNHVTTRPFKEFCSLMKTPPYCDAISEMDLRGMDFSLNKVKLWLLKKRLYRMVFAYYRLSVKHNRARNKR